MDRGLQQVSDGGRDTDSPPRREVPPLVCNINLAVLGLLSVIVVPAAVVRQEQLFGLLALLMLLFAVCWMFRHDAGTMSAFMVLSLSVVLWILVCENIVRIDNILGTQLSRNLHLGMRLQSFVKENIESHKHHFIQACCNDSLSYNYMPGSIHRATYDCATCNDPYETIVDPTGHLNRQISLIENGHADMFLAGDSVLEGTGVPSVVDDLNESLSSKTWNLSVSGYGPRQKVQALIVDALPRNPKWVIIEFFSGNDLNDAIVAQVCEGSSYLCLFNVRERGRRLLRHQLLASMVYPPRQGSGLFDELIENSLTLAVTHYLFDNLKGAVKSITGSSRPVEYDRTYKVGGRSGRRFSAPDVSDPGGNFGFFIRRERMLDWLKEGMRLTQTHYDKLAVAISMMRPQPGVILMYNPSAYEIYRGDIIEQDGEVDRVSEFYRKSLRAYAEKQNWEFLDITDSLRKEVLRAREWIYGKHDRAHWSEKGTRIVGSVLARELSTVVGERDATLK